MKKKISRILAINMLPPIVAFGLLSAYVLLFFIPELEFIAESRGGTKPLVETLFPYTIGVLAVTAAVFIFLAMRSFRAEFSREKIKSSYDIIDEQYQKYIESTSDGFLFIDTLGNIFADNTILSMLDYSSADVIELKPADIINSDADGIELLEHMTAMKNDITGHYETRLIKKNDEAIEVLISASRIEATEMDGFILMVKDISDAARTDAVRINIQKEYSIINLQSALQYIYREAGSMMSEPMIFDEGVKIIEAVKRMNEEHKNTFIVADSNGYAAGIVTDQDLRQRVISGEVESDAPVSSIMSSPVITAEPGIQFFEAFRQMRDNSVRQLVITDGDERPVGILTEKKLIQIQSTNSAVLFEELKRAENVDQLRDCYRDLIFTVRNLVLSGAKAVNITGVVSRTSELITQKLIEHAFLKLGPPPCAFAYIVMGSEGRGEQTLLTDQDNGIIFSDVPSEKTERCHKYFLRLGKHVSDGLNYIGYSYCKGGVMASNPEWVRSESEWSDQFWTWVNGDVTKRMLDVNIIFDFKFIYGERQLCINLREDLWDAIHRFPEFLRRMAATVSEYKPKLTIFGRLQVKKTEHDDEVFDIKKAIGPLIIYARTMALSEKIPETATIARLRVLRDREIITKLQFRNYEQAFEMLTLLRFRDQVQTSEDGDSLNNLIYIKDLTDVEIISLRKIFKQIGKAQDELRLKFTGSMRSMR